MDILGFLFTIAAFVAAPFFGIDKVFRDGMSALAGTAEKAWQMIQDAFERFAIERIIKLLWASGVAKVVLTLIVAVTISGTQGFLWQHGGFFLLAVAIIAAEWGLALYQASAVSRPRHDAGGHVIFEPAWLYDEHGIPLDKHGRPLPRGSYNPVNGEPLDKTNMLPNPLQGRPMVDTANYHPERFRFNESLALLFFGTVLVGGAIGWVGLEEQSRFLWGLGFATIMAALVLAEICLRAFSFVLAKSIKIIESATTLISHQVLIALQGITSENVDRKIGRIEIADEERLALILNSFFPKIRWLLIPFATIVFVWVGYPAFYIAGIIFSTSMVFGILLEKTGGAYEERRLRKNLALFLRYAMPGLSALTVVWELIPTEIKKSWWKTIEVFWASIGASWHAFFSLFTLDNFCSFTPEEWYFRVPTFLFLAFLTLVVGYGTLQAIRSLKENGWVFRSVSGVVSMAAVTASMLLLVGTTWMFSTMVARNDQCAFMGDAVEDVMSSKMPPKMPEGYNFTPAPTPTQAKASAPVPNSAPSAPPATSEAPPAHEVTYIPASPPQPRQNASAPRPRPAPTRVANSGTCSGCNPDFKKVFDSF